MNDNLEKNCKKIQILDAATEVFASRGFEGASIRELASAANVNIAMINYYFGSKEKLFIEIVKYHSEYMNSHVKEIAERKDISHIEKVYLLIDLQVEKLMMHRNFHKLIHHEIMLNHRSDVSDTIMEVISKSKTLTQSIIQDGITAGEFRQVDIQLTLSAIFGTINQLFLSSVICKVILGSENDNPFNPELKKRLVNYLKDLMQHYLVK